MRTGEDSDRRLTGLAVGGTVSFAGSVVGALLNLVLLFVVTWGFDADDAGMIFEVAAMFNILVVVCALGADTGLLRFVARDLAHTHPERRQMMTTVALIPTVVVATIAATAVAIGADEIGRIFAPDAASDLPTFVRAAAFAIPFGAAALVLLGGTRGHGTMSPTALLERIARPAVQILGLVVGVVFGLGWIAVGALWASAYVVLLLGAWWAFRALAPPGVIGRVRATWPDVIEFWSFSLPRALASIFRVGVLYLDVLLVGALIDLRAAALYTVATRLLQMGFLVNNALGQAVEPMFSRQTAVGRTDEADYTYKVATGWGIALTWPWLLTIGIFASAVLGVFVDDVGSAPSALVILALGGMLAVACGPVDVLLVMAGRSGLSFWNSAAALSANIVLNVVLIPEYGLRGAAVAWVVSLMLSNLLPLYQVWRLYGFLPFGTGWLVAASASVGVFGVGGIVARASLGATAAVMVAVVIAAVPLYAAVCWRARNGLDLDEFRVLRVRGRATVIEEPTGSS